MMSGSRVLEASLDRKSILRVFNTQNRRFSPAPLSILAEWILHDYYDIMKRLLQLRVTLFSFSPHEL